MNDLFNTPFETGLRAMLTLYLSDKNGVTIDRISSYDFMTIYAYDLGISDHNLHGINHFNFSELSSKRKICSEGVKQFVLEGLIAVNRNAKGFLYYLTPSGRHFIESLESNYKTQYLEILNKVQMKYDKISDDELVKIINTAAINSLRR